MILQAETLIEYGYLPLDLKLQSHKPILAACDNCGNVREIHKDGYRSLCNSCAKKGRTFTEEWKANMSVAMKGKTNRLGSIHTEVTKVLMSVAQKGDKHWNWQGGKSFEPYCIKFNAAYKQLIRTKFNNKCFWCDMTTEENGQALDVHHVNYNKNCGCDETKCICVPLCHSCHMKTNYDRDFWQEKIMKKLKLLGIPVEDQNAKRKSCTSPV